LLLFRGWGETHSGRRLPWNWLHSDAADKQDTRGLGTRNARRGAATAAMGWKG
jgi:hypothetical protein